MTLVNAIKVLFVETAPAGADFEGAFNALKGKKDSDLSSADAATLDVLAETFQDFVGDPSDWIRKAPRADSRHSWWVKLGQALGASVTTGPAPALAVPSTSPSAVASATPAAPVVPEPEPEQGIDPDALAGGAPPPGRREGGGSKGGDGYTIATGDGDADDDRPRRERKKRGDRHDRRDRDEDEDDDRDDRRREPRGRQERRPPEPPPRPTPLFDVNDRTIPAITREILAYSSYCSWSTWLIEAFRLIRTGTPAEQAQKRAEIPHARRLIKSMKDSGEHMEVQTGFHLERLLEVLEFGRDQREPAWFQANYITGTYAN